MSEETFVEKEIKKDVDKKWDAQLAPMLLSGTGESKMENNQFRLVRRDLPPVINLTETHGNAIYEIEHIRTRNNSLWMELLKIALEYAPVKTKEVLKQINENDNAVSKLLKGLIDD